MVFKAPAAEQLNMDPNATTQMWRQMSVASPVANKKGAKPEMVPKYYPESPARVAPQRLETPSRKPMRSRAVTVALDDVKFDPTAQRAPGAKIRILETADDLFYGEGIRTVGIDRLISTSKVTKATFYKHFGSKDRLILMYIEARHTAEVARFEGILESSQYVPEEQDFTEEFDEEDAAPSVGPGPEGALRAIVAATMADIAAPGFRGDPFLNAATEFSEERHPVRSVVLRHREWLTGFLAEILQDLGHRMPGDAADDFILARDGAMSGGYAGDPIAASASLSRITDAVIRAAAS